MKSGVWGPIALCSSGGTAPPWPGLLRQWRERAAMLISGAMLMSSSSLSAAGDLLIISTIALSYEARRLLTVRLIACFAVADLLGQLPIVGSFPLHSLKSWGDVFPGGPTFCELQAAGNWYAMYASWLWTMAYAHAVSSAMPYRQPERAGCCVELARLDFHETHYHALCWGLPAIAIGSALAAGLFGPGDGDYEICTFRHSDWALSFYALLWLALGYNCYVYVTVLRVVSRAVDATSQVLEPTASHAIARRLDALGARFALYLLTFILSQSPCLVRHLLIVIGVKDATWTPTFDDVTAVSRRIRLFSPPLTLIHPHAQAHRLPSPIVLSAHLSPITFIPRPHRPFARCTVS